MYIYFVIRGIWKSNYKQTRRAKRENQQQKGQDKMELTGCHRN